ncbi:methyltransferase family protein [Rhizobium sp. LjRoot254]|uniref:methyltransferase family protein n=1 Tax=Rhizobium sp. LjRoot254 TaxID=3342297 RepID=UPI003ECD6CF6
MKKLLPPVLFLLAIIVLIAARYLWPQSNLIPPPWHWLGLLLIVAGLVVGIPAANRFHRIGTNIRTFNEPGQLVTEGAFRYTRNPMYLGFSLMLLGLAIVFPVLTSFIVVIAFVVITDRWYIRFEEAAMERKFGDAYREYKSRVRRWL